MIHYKGKNNRPVPVYYQGCFENLNSLEYKGVHEDCEEACMFSKFFAVAHSPPNVSKEICVNNTLSLVLTSKKQEA